MKELGGKTGVLVGLDVPRLLGKLKQGSKTHIRLLILGDLHQEAEPP